MSCKDVSRLSSLIAFREGSWKNCHIRPSSIDWIPGVSFGCGPIALAVGSFWNGWVINILFSLRETSDANRAVEKVSGKVEIPD